VLVTSVGNEPVTAVGFSADGWFVYAALKQNRVWQIRADGSLADVFDPQTVLYDLRGLVFHPHTPDVYAFTSTQIVRVAGTTHHDPISIKSLANTNGISSCAIVNQKLIAVGSGHSVGPRPVPGFFRLVSLYDGKDRGTPISEKGGVIDVTAHEPSNTVAWATGTREVVVWDMAKPDRVRISFQHPAGAIAFTSDGTMIAMAMQWNVALWDWKKKQERAVLKGHKGRVTAISCLPDGSILTASWDGTVKVWDTTGMELRSLDFQQGRLTGLAVSRDGSRAAVGTDRGIVVIWDLV
jgi:WD40 repeat protein